MTNPPKTPNPPKKKPTSPAPTPLSFHWRDHNSGGSSKRVWRNDWFFTDHFEILTILEFQQLNSICKRFSIPLIEVQDD